MKREANLVYYRDKRWKTRMIDDESTDADIMNVSEQIKEILIYKNRKQIEKDSAMKMFQNKFFTWSVQKKEYIYIP